MMRGPQEAHRRRFIGREVLIAVAINCLFSAFFAYVMFGDHASVSVWGWRGLAVDFVPQTFILSAVTVFATTLVARQSLRAKNVVARSKAVPWRLPKNLVARALMLAALATCVLGGSAISLLALSAHDALSSHLSMGLKVIYGGVAGAVVALTALITALSEGVAIDDGAAPAIDEIVTPSAADGS
jgi:hypothetical protein